MADQWGQIEGNVDRQKKTRDSISFTESLPILPNYNVVEKIVEQVFVVRGFYFSIVSFQAIAIFFVCLSNLANNQTRTYALERSSAPKFYTVHRYEHKYSHDSLFRAPSTIM